MEFERLAERAVLVRGVDPGLPADLLPLLQDRWADLEDAAPAFDTLGLYFSGPPPPDPEVKAALASLPRSDVQPREHFLPVCYELGEDLADAARLLGMATGELAEIHAAGSYRCQAVGFVPGFPYLSGLDPRLASLPRRPTPRPEVPAGSVAIAEDLCGVYPSAVPGGWTLIGRCPLGIADEDSAWFPIAPGDRIRFRRIGRAEFDALRGGRL